MTVKDAAFGVVLGRRIRRCLKLRGEKQKDLARKLGVTESTMSRYMNGAASVSAERVMEMAAALGTNAGYLMGEEKTPEEAVEMERRLMAEADRLLRERMGDNPSDSSAALCGYFDCAGRGEISLSDISRRLGIPYSTICMWRRIYLKGGLDALIQSRRKKR